MAEDKGAESGAEAGAESGDAEIPGDKVTADRPAEEYAKKLVDVSAENKKFRQKNSQLAKELEDREKRLKSLEEEKLKEQGQWQKMYETEKSERTKLEDQAKRDRANFAFKSVTSALAAEAAKAGCAKVDDLIKLATADGIISELEVSNEDFSITPESLKAALEKAQKAYPYLYAKSTPKVNDGIPNGKGPNSAVRKDLTTMKMEDLINMAKTVSQ